MPENINGWLLHAGAHALWGTCRSDYSHMQRFATFDAAKAQCFFARDRDRLLAVIEASFRDFYDFNRVVRKLFAKRVSDPSARRSSSPHLTSCNQVHLSIRSLAFPNSFAEILH
jgi:hypothetical protein